MIIKSNEFKECCTKILTAIDNNELSLLTETLELKTEGKNLLLNVTNREYYVSVKFNLDHEEDFYATINANLFLKLISQITAEEIQLERCDTYIKIKGNGDYKIPLIFDNDKLMALPPITINNKTVEMTIQSSILESILNYNTKELLKGTVSKPVQKMFYIDETGCITFTSGACVNSFKLEKPIKILLNQRVVKLFKLFKNVDVKFTLGYDSLSDSLIQTKVCFETDNIVLTAILSCDNTLLNMVPVNAIRGRANYSYPYSIVLNKDALVAAINRLMLFSSGYGTKENLKPYSIFEFGLDRVTIYDSDKDNKEELIYQNDTSLQSLYTVVLDLIDFKTVLDGCTEQYVSLNFGDGQAVVLVRTNIKNVIPQVKVAVETDGK